MEIEVPVRLKLPAPGEWPFFRAPAWLRNGREAGAWAVGCIDCIPEKCAHVQVPTDYVAGATHALIEGSMMVRSHSFGDATTTLEVRCAWQEFVEG